jgi:hypothetical protein
MRHWTYNSWHLGKKIPLRDRSLWMERLKTAQKIYNK